MVDSEEPEVVDPEPDIGDGPVPAGWYPEPGNPDRKRYWDGEEWGAPWKEPKARPPGKANRLAVTALICSCIGPVLVGGVLGTVFGFVALDEIQDSDGSERGQGMAQWAIALGALNIALSCVLAALVVIALTR